MKKTFKKIITSVMAVTTLTVCTTGFSASAVEPRYGGSGTFYVNGVAVHKSIDGYKSSAGASTACYATQCTALLAGVSGRYNDDTLKSDYNVAERGKVSVGIVPNPGKEFVEVDSGHAARINGVDGQDNMCVML